MAFKGNPAVIDYSRRIDSGCPGPENRSKFNPQAYFASNLDIPTCHCCCPGRQIGPRSGQSPIVGPPRPGCRSLLPRYLKSQASKIIVCFAKLVSPTNLSSLSLSPCFTLQLDVEPLQTTFCLGLPARIPFRLPSSSTGEHRYGGPCQQHKLNRLKA